jgi:branched-subunit amino acid transport protein
LSLVLIVTIALLTYGSRAFALALMPDPSPRLRTVLDRIPAPLFASLAAISVIGDGELASPETLSAAFGALIATPTRSLLWVLVAGLAGYVVGALAFG